MTIEIIRRDGSRLPLNSRELGIHTKSGSQERALMQGDTLQLVVETTAPVAWEIGDWAEVFGAIYKLNRLPQMTKSSESAFAYALELEGVQYDLARVDYELSVDTTRNEKQDILADALTGTLQRFGEVLVSNANRVFPNEWRLGQVPQSTETKTLTFSGDDNNALKALQLICKEYSAEFRIRREGAVHIIDFVDEGTGAQTDAEFRFGRGRGLYKLERQHIDSKNITTRLKVLGGERNIPSGYRASRLCLPGASKSQSFIEDSDKVAMFGVWEASKVFDDIYPTRTGIVSGVSGDNPLSFSDSSMFDLGERNADGSTKYLIAGANAKVHFNTGQLAGYELDVASYDHATRSFSIKPVELKGLLEKIPSAKYPELRVRPGDEYRLLDIALPDFYIEEAERRLGEEARAFYEQNAQPKGKYTLHLSERFLAERYAEQGVVPNIFALGDYVHVVDPDIGVDKHIRIIGYTRDLLNPYQYKLVLGDAVQINFIQRLVSDGVARDKAIVEVRGQSVAQARRSYQQMAELKELVFDQDGYYDPEKIRPLSVETSMLAVGAKANQLMLAGLTINPKADGISGKVSHTACALTHLYIEDTPRTWSIPSGSVVLTESVPYYIYAVVDRRGDSARLVFSKEQYRIDSSPTHYRFWLGVVHAPETGGVRQVSLTYGATYINGRYISTGRIQSADGATYFDLDRGEIGGRIVFRGGKDADTFVSEIVEASIPEKRVTIDAKALDPNKYYPVVIPLINFEPGKGVSRYSFALQRTLSTIQGAPPYASHSGGFSLRIEWTVSIAGWGINDRAREITHYSKAHLKDGENAISEPNQIHQASHEYIYVRGGSQYEIIVKWDGNPQIKDRLTPELKAEGHRWSYTHTNGRVEEVVLPVLDSIADRLPKTDITATLDSAKAHAVEQARLAIQTSATEIGDVRKATQRAQQVADQARDRVNDTYRRAETDGVITSAEERAIAAARVNAEEAKRHADDLVRRQKELADAQYAALLANVDTLEQSLRAQIDGVTIRWFGTAFPPARKPWVAEGGEDTPDNDRRHEGDTYTVVAPDGVTITEGNAHQYPDVGKSWRWAHGGWSPIADSDVTHALALAGEAKASADGKVAHFTGEVLPVGYQRGDLWTLPKDWNGYKAGSILVAVASEIKGQVNFGHWRESNRYTDDTAVKNLKVGHRNLVLRSGVVSDRATYQFAWYKLAEPWEPLQEYSVSVWAEVYGQPTGPLAGTPPTIGIYVDGGSRSIGRATIAPSTQLVDGAYRGVWTLTGKCPEDAPASPSFADGKVLSLFLMGNTIDPRIRVVVNKVSIVKGGRPPMDWANAPEDIAQDEAIARAIDEHLTTEALRNAKRGEADSLLANTDLPTGAERSAITQRLTYEQGAYTSLNSEIAKLRAGTSRNTEIVATKRLNWSNTYKLLSDAVEGGRRAIARATNVKLELTRQELEQARAVADDAKRVADSAVTQAQADGKITEAEARVIAETYKTYRNAVVSEWALLAKRYEQTYSNAYLTGTPKSGLQTAHSNALASYNALTSRIDTIIADGKVVQAEVAPYNSAVADYTAKATALVQALEVADKAIQAELLREAGEHANAEVERGKERTKVSVDTRGLNEAKYYPLTIKLVQERGKMTTNRIKVSRSIGDHLGVPSYSAHAQGFSVDLEWAVKGSGWGSRPADRRVSCYSLLHVKAGEAVVSMPSQIIQISYEYVYVRGGSIYEVEVQAGNGIEIAVHSAGFAQGTYALPVLDSIANRLPSTDIDDAKRYATDKANEAYQRAQSYIDGDYLHQAIKDGSTRIEGGLMASNIIALSPPFAPSVTTYLSGDPDRLVAFAAGVQDFATPQETRMIEMLHDGRARFGDLILRPNGQLAFIRQATGVDDQRRPFLEVGGDIRPLDELLEASGEVVTRSAASWSISDVYRPSATELSGGDEVLIDSIVLSKPMFQVRIQGALTASTQAIPDVDAALNGGSPFATSITGTGSTTISIHLERSGVIAEPVAYAQVASGGNISLPFDKTFTMSSAGTYRLVMRRTHSYTTTHNVHIVVRNLHLRAEKTNDYDKMYFGDGGFVALFNLNRYVYIGREGDYALDVGGDVRIKGTVEMNGTLARGEVAANGLLRWCSGPKAHRAGTEYGHSSVDGNKVYTVHHSVGHTQYAVVVTPHNTRDAGCIVEKAANYFRVRFNGTADMNNYHHAFDYVVEGDLTASYKWG